MQVPVRLYQLSIVAVAVMATTYYAVEIGVTQNRVLAIWPAAGIALWACWRFGYSGARATFVGLTAHSLFGLSDPVIDFVNSLVPFLCALILTAKCDFDQKSSIENLTWIMFAGLLLSFVTAAFGGPYLTYTYNMDWSGTLGLSLRWFLADVTGVLLFAPLFFAATNARSLRLIDFVGIELTLAAICSALLIIVLFLMPWTLSLSIQSLLVISPFIFFIITRKHTLRVSSACSVIGFCALSLVAIQLNNDNVMLLETQLFLLTLLTCAMFIHYLLVESSRANDLLELRVQERTEELATATLAAKAADHSKSQFLANTSHELRTPLNGVLGMARSLSKQQLGSENDKKVQTIVSSGESLLTPLNDVIDLSKIEAHQLEVTPVATDIAALLKEIESLWQIPAAENSVNFRLESFLPTSNWYLLDPQRFKQCVNNLVSNAVKFSGGGEVFVAVRQSGEDQLEVEVRDTGIGIKSENLARLFLPFEQLDSSISRTFGGTGLGLSITKQLVDLMDGSIHVSSSYGKGSIFSFSIKADLAEPEEIEDQFEQDLSKLDNIRTLLVEDNEINRMVVVDLLENMQIDEAEHGARALEMLAEQDYELVLLDIQMPVMDGIETIKRIRSSTEAWADIPVVALTANAMSEDRAELLGLGMSGYASKPIDPPSLLSEMLGALRNSN